jgi:outer membrane protein assembly factor BamB
MVSHTHRQLHNATILTHVAIGALFALAGCSTGPVSNRTAATAGWTDPGVNAVSRPMSGAGVTAVTSLRKDGMLETDVYDLAAGTRLWARPATMVGRPAGMGVAPPALLGPMGAAVVVALEPRKQGSERGRWNATLVARDARTGRQKWTRPVDSTFGPVRCGPYVCLSEFTARKDARFVALDPATGRGLWKLPGIAEVEWSDDPAMPGRSRQEGAARVVLFRMAAHPTLESHDLATGKALWSFPVEQAVGMGVNLSGGWAFGATGATLVGYLAPYQAKKGGPLSAFGFFGLRLADGHPVWVRPRLLRIYPSANPAVTLITREIDPSGRYGGFARLDPRSGRTISQIPAGKVPRGAWWLAFPADLSTLGFLAQDHAGTAFDLARATPVPVKGLTSWSFCTVDPAQLQIQGRPGFYPIASLCAYDLATGKPIGRPGPPPAWYTGVVDGSRVWRDETGALHGAHDAKGTSPGMYG